MKKIILVIFFLFLAPINLLFSILYLLKISPRNNNIPIFSVQNPSLVFASFPSASSEITVSLSLNDARPVILKKYFQKHKSPLLPYVSQLLNAAEKYNVDYRLIVAIAQCESNLCKKIPLNSYNCWGFENGETKFLSWEQAFNQVAKTLREEYLDKGLTTPEEIMPKYAPPSVEKGGPWAKCVNQFINELEYGLVD